VRMPGADPTQRGAGKGAPPAPQASSN
jgi:hypothetical protein